MPSSVKRLIALLGTALGLCGCDHGGFEKGGMTAATDAEMAPPQHRREAPLASADALRAAGKPIEAMARLAEAHRQNPGDPAIASAYGRIALLLGHDDVAEPLLAQAVAANPRDWRALSAQGVLESRRGRLLDGRRAFDKAERVSQREAVILNNLAVNHLLEDKPAAAASLLRQGLAAADLRPEHAGRMRRNLALALAVQGQFTEADRLAGEPLPRTLAGADGPRLAQLLGVSEARLAPATAAGWQAEIATTAPRPAAALR